MATQITISGPEEAHVRDGSSTKRRLSLAALAPELLSQIVSYSSLRDLFNLLQTCKTIYSIAYPELWTTIYLFPHFYGRPHGWPDRAIGQNGMQKLVNLVEAGGVGYKNIKNLIFDRRMAGQDESGLGGAPAMYEFLTEKLKSGDINIKYFEIPIYSGFGGQLAPNQSTNLLPALKAYSETKSQDEFSLNLMLEGLSGKPEVLASQIDCSKLTSLSFHFFNVESAEISNPDWDHQRNSISALTTVIEAATRLKYLCLDTTVNTDYYEMSPEPSSPVLLQGFQAAISNLKHLRTFHIRNYIFDPFFFIKPPSSVRVVKFTEIHKVSRSWWEQFAAYDFPGVESLTIDYPADACAKRKDWWRGIEDGQTARDHGGYDGFQHWKFSIGSVAVTGLKEFIYEDRRDYLAPIDLVDCIIRQNPHVRKQWKRKLAERYENILFAECNARFLGLMKDEGFSQVRDSLKNRFVKRCLNGKNGEEEEEIELYIAEYGKELVKWIKRNMAAQ
ncbi:hypothetical protein TWF730_010903 [Orbilia blumenaviensis]|uniref:F-box domain-containing protein n=1 Tax=Orbilia blumenaviensis TaxID=1796055 RepID=A0AAV9UM38_9PEZI